MEFEISDDGRSRLEDEDLDIIDDHMALKNQSSVDPNSYPGDNSPLVRKPDKAEHIPEQDEK
ncbi:hypothetical protein [Paraurantiacibacter namhicola]|uniref:Uncharacterized protein n=1 Tax=Paraurantiacibacter namhicola TaxID=645517 RepID=A0A1C7D9C7_9SPHN|nr:hypothetical protein [Paraurantiacibacter namhicola]ANU07972.1 hypothetical protein A6F65_01675 [Paraurantiacibacter namhicola]